MTTATLIAGIPATNRSLYHRIHFLAGDPAATIDLPADHPSLPGRTLIIRDIEMDRARAHAKAARVVCPADYTPDDGLSGDREIATAQATAEFLRRAGATRVVSDRSLPLVFAEMIKRAGLALECDLDLGVLDRRAKDAQEIELLREAQAVTEGAMRMACEMVAHAEAGPDGILTHEGEPLTAERVMSAIDIWLLERAYANPGSIVAPGPIGADCHERGHGPIRTGQPVIIDIFPQNKHTLYNGDCTRVVVHGQVPEELARMHDTVVRAKKAAIAATRAGVTGESVHRAAIEVITAAGYHTGLPEQHAEAGKDPSFCSMVHGTGHGIGLDVHEPPLLDMKGPELVVGDALTIEPGLYCAAIGGVRIEDMVVVTESGCENLNTLPEGLDWA
ncbi:MAG: M24 family metallopeptidase [Phycisphaerales bacterium JB050]